MKKITMQIAVLAISLVNNKMLAQNTEQSDLNVVYGKKHIYTIETPSNWLNDKVTAKKFGLVNFFYAKTDSLIKQKSYIYSFGIDKISSTETLNDFINGDLKKFSEKYPAFSYDKINVGFTGGVKNGILYSFSNLTDKFKEEVLYCKTDSAFIIFSFSATTKQNYSDYQPVFDSFINSFQYRGDNPKPFLDYMYKR